MHRNVTIAPDEVAGAMGVHAEKASARLVICVGAEHPVPDELQAKPVLSNRLVSVPLVLDAVTGAQLAIPARDCNDPIITR